jgi:hypothetical protein
MGSHYVLQYSVHQHISIEGNKKNINKAILERQRALLSLMFTLLDRLCGLVVRVSGYRYRGPGFDSQRYQIF